MSETGAHEAARLNPLGERQSSLHARATPRRISDKLPRYDYDEIIDALEGEEDDAADSGGEDYELAG